ncbi:hypothetical protein, partial [Candidatus Binatus sp.]|uniref:hypothetical protein n=1 Tax=Candidatus Binatus sp. TaxID=2811406 RepID=UPI003CC6DAD8
QVTRCIRPTLRKVFFAMGIALLDFRREDRTMYQTYMTAVVFEEARRPGSGLTAGGALVSGSFATYAAWHEGDADG